MERNYETQHAELVRKLAAECTVLLKKDGRFPLEKPCTIALYGSGARRTVKGGTGSGEVNSRYFITIEQGLEDAGFTVTTKDWLDAYDTVVTEAHKAFIQEIRERAKKKHVFAVMEGMGAIMPEPEYDLPIKVQGDTAIYVLARISGEGADRKNESGDILLSASERRDILRLNDAYENFMLVLNVGGPVDLTPVKDVKNILVLSQLGAETGNTFADLILGKSYPSGKLSTTWATEADYPGFGTFGETNDTRYEEGVYVGYRYFDAANKMPLYPFGFGLGYTDFALRVDGATENTVTVTVENVGKFPGKEVVELYIAPPQQGMDKPLRGLVAFAKTEELKPGASETLTIPYDLKEIASYNAEKAALVLEPGIYTVVANDTPAVSLRLSEEVVLRRVRNALGNPGFADWKPETKPELPACETVIELDPAALITETVQYDAIDPIDPEIAALDDDSLLKLNIGAYTAGGIASMIGNASQSVAGAAGETAHIKDFPVLVMADGPAGVRINRDYYRDKKGVHAIGETMPESIVELLTPFQQKFLKLLSGKPKVKGDVQHQYCTAIPIGTAIAQSRNMALAEAFGDLVGDEMERFDVHLWLAPALNIHRNIRCGRNFEYYSEDPLLSGKCAAAITKGVQKHPGCGTTIKHFTANNQEYNRSYNNSQVSERAMREIYLKGFEICVRESQPHALMTSYNLLNGTHTSERRDLITDILRAEWGYQGIVMTDWVVSGITMDRASIYRNADPACVAAAGGDLFMPGSKGDFKKLKKALRDGKITKKQLQANATRVLRMARLLNQLKKEC